MSGGWRRNPGRLAGPSMVALAGWCAFAIYLVVQARLGPPLLWADSTVYTEMAHHSIWSRALWAGPRPPLTPLVLKMVGGASALVTVQAVVGAASWGVLAWTVGRLVAPGWRRVTATFLVLGFATTLPIVLWNRSELSESLSMSLLALMVAGFLWTAQHPTWPRVTATVLACLGFAATRDAQVWTVGILAVASGVYALGALVTRRGTPLRAGVLAVALVAVVALCEWGTLTSQRTAQDTADVLFVRVFPFADRVAWFAAHGMPEAKRIDQLAAGTPVRSDDVRVVAVPPRDPAFRPLEQWLRSEGQRTYFLWLATHPGFVVGEPLQRPERAFNFAHGDIDFYAPTTHTAASPLTGLLWPPLLELLVLSAGALYLGIASEAWRTAPWRMAVVLTLVGVAAMVVAWHGDGQEVTRHTVEGFAQVRLGVWILFALGLLASPVVDREAETTAAAAPGVPPGRVEGGRTAGTAPVRSVSGTEVVGASGAEAPPHP